MSRSHRTPRFEFTVREAPEGRFEFGAEREKNYRGEAHAPRISFRVPPDFNDCNFPGRIISSIYRISIGIPRVATAVPFSTK